MKFPVSTPSLKKAHRAGAYLLLPFLVLHLTNHLAGVISIDSYRETQQVLRSIYRSPFLEPIVIGAVVLQILIGLVLLVRAFRTKQPSGAWRWAQAISGAVLLFCIAEHMIALLFAQWPLVFSS